MRCESPHRKTTKKAENSLNPCFSGICAARRVQAGQSEKRIKVLILVLVEYALRVYPNKTQQALINKS